MASSSPTHAPVTPAAPSVSEDDFRSLSNDDTYMDMVDDGRQLTQHTSLSPGTATTLAPELARASASTAAVHTDAATSPAQPPSSIPLLHRPLNQVTQPNQPPPRDHHLFSQPKPDPETPTASATSPQGNASASASAAISTASAADVPSASGPATASVALPDDSPTLVTSASAPVPLAVPTASAPSVPSVPLVPVPSPAVPSLLASQDTGTSSSNSPTTSTTRRQSAFQYPTFHLDSFKSLSYESFTNQSSASASTGPSTSDIATPPTSASLIPPRLPIRSPSPTSSSILKQPQATNVVRASKSGQDISDHRESQHDVQERAPEDSAPTTATNTPLLSTPGLLDSLPIRRTSLVGPPSPSWPSVQEPVQRQSVSSATAPPPSDLGYLVDAVPDDEQKVQEQQQQPSLTTSPSTTTRPLTIVTDADKTPVVPSSPASRASGASGGASAFTDSHLAWPQGPRPPSAALSARESVSAGASGSVGDVHADSPLTPTNAQFEFPPPRLVDSPNVPRRRTLIAASHSPSAVQLELQQSPTARPPTALPTSSAPDQRVQPQSPQQLLLHPERRSSLLPPAKRASYCSTTSSALEAAAADASSLAPPIDLSSTSNSTPKRTSTSTISAGDARPGSLTPRGRALLPSSPQSPNSSSDPSRKSIQMTMPMPMPMPVPNSDPSRRSSTHHPTSPSKNGAGLGIQSYEPAAIRQVRTRSPDRSSARYQTSPVPSGKQFDMPTPNVRKSVSVPPPSGFQPSHQPAKSASNLPAIAGLADAGPYPTPVNNNAPLAKGSGGGGFALPGDVSGQPGPQKPIKPNEEICLECMMRDRDLADVDVSGPGCWERDSNAAFEVMKERETEVLRTLAQEDALSRASFEASVCTGESGSTPRSHVSAPAPDDTSRSADEKRKQLKEARRARRAERDAQVARVGWRGFKWEEGPSGEGFPKGFAGTRPGALTEKGIKNVMQMYPSSSALRYQILQNYLRGQYRLILEVRQEAQRIGHYTEPEDPHYPNSQETHESSLDPSSTISRHKPRNQSIDQGAPSIKAPSVSTARSVPILSSQVPMLRQSPSTPAGLGNVSVQARRPRTQYVPDREPGINGASLSAQTSRQTLSINTPTQRPSSHFKAPSSTSVPKARGSQYYTDDWSDTEDLWAPSSPASGNLRPFSFAVRAGAGGGQGSDGGHSRKSFFGRFGGSVTSLFTGAGSHGGSGSMMDMHLGLESDRRNRTSSYQAHEQPRVLPGMAPGRPSFQGGRNSVATSMYLGNGGARSSDDVMLRERRAHSTSASRLTQVSMYGDDFDRSSATTEKKKGFKGLIQKMKKGKKDPSRRGTEELAPPPPMGFLVNRQDGKHNRNRSGSSSSFIEAPSPVPQQQMQMARSVPGGSINGPMTAPSSGSDVSPTSSRFGPDGRQRTNPVPELPPGAESAGYPGATMEMLAHLPGNSPVQATHSQQQLEPPMFTDEPQAMNRDPFARSAETASDGNRSPSLYTVQGGSRKSMQPSVSSRLSTSTTMQGLETPDGQPYLNGSYSQQPASQQSLSPNRHKNLPPLPPGMATPEMYSSHQDDGASISIRTSLFDPKRMSSMDQGRALCPPSSDYFPTASPRYHQAPMPNGAVQSSPSSTGSSVMPPQGNLPLPRRPIQPRASFDVLSDARARIRRSTAESGRMPMEDMGGRNAQSMYIQQPAAASTGSFGRFISRDAPLGPKGALVVPTLRKPYGEERKERRRGIKSIFSSKAR